MKTESIVDIWGQTDESPYDFAYEYGLTIKELSRDRDQVYYLFEGPTENVDRARANGYFYATNFI